MAGKTVKETEEKEEKEEVEMAVTVRKEVLAAVAASEEEDSKTYPAPCVRERERWGRVKMKNEESEYSKYSYYSYYSEYSDYSEKKKDCCKLRDEDFFR